MIWIMDKCGWRNHDHVGIKATIMLTCFAKLNSLLPIEQPALVCFRTSCLAVRPTVAFPPHGPGNDDERASR